MDVTTFLDQHHNADLSPLQRALAGDALADARASAADRQQEAARRAAAEERVELLQLAFRQGGIPAGELQRFRAIAVEADDEIRDLSDRLAKATARRDRAHAGITALTAQLDEINRAVASRAAVPDLLGPAREALAGHLEYVAASRAAWSAAQAGTPARARRPFASRGSVPGDDDPVKCPGCAAVGASAIESFRIHHEDLGPVPDDFTEADLDRFPYQDTGRAGGNRAPFRSSGSGGEITRAVDAGIAVR